MRLCKKSLLVVLLFIIGIGSIGCQKEVSQTVGTQNLETNKEMNSDKNSKEEKRKKKKKPGFILEPNIKHL